MGVYRDRSLVYVNAEIPANWWVADSGLTNGWVAPAPESRSVCYEDFSAVDAYGPYTYRLFTRIFNGGDRGFRFKNGHLIFLIWSGTAFLRIGHVVDTTGGQGVTAQQTPRRKHEALERPVHGEGLDGVGRAARVVAA